MTLHLKPYPAYKESGVPWLGRVPGHWATMPLKRWVRINASVLPEDTAGEYRFWYLDIGAVGTGTLNQRPQRLRFLNAPSRARRVLRQGDTIVSTVRTYLKAVYHLASCDDDLVCSTGFAVLSPQPGTNPKWVSYLVQSNPFTERVSAESVGTAYPAIAETKLAAFHVPVPPASEQSAIVRFLDYADRRIRRYIRAKRRLIDLLNEQKQAIIHRAVARGLDPNVPLRPSGVEWLGEVPQHWDIRRAKFCYREVDDRSTTGSEELLSVSHITGVTPRSQKNITMFMAESNVGHKLCRPGDLVINTMWAWMAALGVSRQHGVVSPSYGVYRPIRPARLLDEYADCLLRTWPYRAEYWCRSTGIRASRFRLYPEDFLRICLLCPPLPEQETIVRFVNAETRDLHAAMHAAEKEIGLVREYRTRLIADVVTGKLDVREAAADLPDENGVEDLGDVEEAESTAAMEEPTEAEGAPDADE